MAIVKTGTLPAGQYYVGDPCYVLGKDDAVWKAFLAAYWAANGDSADACIFTFNGHACFVSGTNTGDGCYRDQHGAEYPVDAGMIGAIPVALITGAGVTFPKTFNVGATPGTWNRHGKYIRIGHITIRT